MEFDVLVKRLSSLEMDPTKHAMVAATISDETAADLAHSFEEEELAAMQSSLGLFFNTGLKLNGSKVWKSCFGAPHTMFIFKSESGWYCSNMVWESEKQLVTLQGKNSQVAIGFWSKAEADEHDYPRHALHMPYWRSKPRLGSGVKTTLELISEQQEKRHAFVPAAPLDDAASSHGSEKASGSKGKGGHGGWLSRCAALINEYQHQRWHEFDRLVETYKSFSQQLRSLLDA